MSVFAKIAKANRIMSEVEFFENFVEKNMIIVTCKGTGDTKYVLCIHENQTTTKRVFSGANLQNVLHQVYETYHQLPKT